MARNAGCATSRGRVVPKAMLEILEEPLVRENVSPISVRFYHEAGAAGMISEDVELLEGVIVKKRSKSPLHEFIVARLLRLLSEVLRPGIFAAKKRPITTADSEPEPDIAVIEGQEDDFFDHHPESALLVIEAYFGGSGKTARPAACMSWLSRHWLGRRAIH